MAYILATKKVTAANRAKFTSVVWFNIAKQAHLSECSSTLCCVSGKYHKKHQALVDLHKGAIAAVKLTKECQANVIRVGSIDELFVEINTLVARSYKRCVLVNKFINLTTSNNNIFVSEVTNLFNTKVTIPVTREIKPIYDHTLYQFTRSKIRAEYSKITKAMNNALNTFSKQSTNKSIIYILTKLMEEDNITKSQMLKNVDKLQETNNL